MGGFPQVEGAISMPLVSAHDYIRVNFILNLWNGQNAISCETVAPDEYRAVDLFSHVIFHRERRYGEKIADSFTNAQPSSRDDYVWIYRLEDLRDSCPA